MDALLEAVAKLFLVFKDPVNVILLLVAASSLFANYYIVRFLLNSWEAAIESRLKLSASLDGLTDIIKELKDGKTSG